MQAVFSIFSVKFTAFLDDLFGGAQPTTFPYKYTFAEKPKLQAGIGSCLLRDRE